MVELVPLENVKLRIRGTGKISSVLSVATGKAVATVYVNDLLTLTLPRLDEGDVLLLE